MLILPNYQIRTKIDESANSVVYRGIRKPDNLPVILKILKADYPTLEELTRYRQEYDITRLFADVDGVIKVYALEKYKNTLVIVLEDFGGESLKGALALPSGGNISFSDFIPLAIQITKALGNIHATHIIHKDINPTNIVWNQSTHQLKIIDFGIASRLPRENPVLKNPEQLEGTLAYISPEQTGRMNQSLDYRTDLYSLGVTFYELLTGQLPYESNSAMELVHGHIAKIPKPISEINPDIPPIISDIVTKLMAKNVEDRYQSTLGVKADFEKFQEKMTGLEELKGLQFELAQNDFSGKLQIPPKLYGREKEVNTLLQAFERISQGASEMMLVAGYSGVGKTALVHEIHKPMTERHGHFVTGKFDQLRHNIPYSALSQAFNGFCQYLLTENSEILEQWREKILKAVSTMGQVLIDVIPQLELIIGPQPAVEQIPPTESQNRFNLVFQNFLQVFCQKEHPLVLFIDDLQWVDSASLNLLTHLMTDTKTHYFFIIGAYRDNEVNSTHPLIITINALSEAEVTINTMVLPNLSVNDVNHLIAESLNGDFALAQELTQLVYEKTQGNAFFTHEFLNSLYKQGLLEFDFQTRSWQWEVKKIAALDITDNVVELLFAKIGQLPLDTVERLKLAACIGNQFDLKTLSIISQYSQADTLTHLWAAIHEGLVLPQDDNYKLVQEPQQKPQKLAFFKFLHDRVQQAAYALIDEAQKERVHLSIGQLLLDNSSLETEDDQLFQILEHLNIARPLIVEKQQKIELAQLNLRAGIKAKQATAYVAALQYLIIGISSIGEQTWENHYDLALALHKERAELEFLNGHFEESERVIRQTVERVKTPLEKAEVLHILIVQYTLTARYPKAIQTGRQALGLLGIDLADENFEPIRDQEMLAIKTLIGDRTIASLFDLPIMTDPIYTMAVKLLITMGPPCYRSHQRLWGVIVAKVVHLTLQYGHVPQIGYSHTAYGGLLGYVWQDYTTGKELGKLATRLMNEKFTDSAADQSVFYLMIGSSIRHWYEPLQHATQDYQKAYQIGLESGNLQYAVYAFGHNMYCRFYQGVNLSELLTEVEGYLAFCRSRKNQWGIDLMEAGQLVILNLMAEGASKGTATTEFSKPDLTESQFVERCEAHENIQVLCIFYILKTQALYLHGHFESALKSAKEAENRIISVATQGLLPSSEHRFTESFLLLALYSQVSPAQQQEYWEKLTANQQFAEIWVNNCPDNFQHQYLLIAAEMARLSGNALEAMDLYDQAIASAQKSGFIQNEALGNELAAQFWLERGKEEFAHSYLKKAHYSYQLWGAKRKIKDLEEKYPQLFFVSQTQVITQSVGNTTMVIASSSNRHISLDLESLMKAAQTLSGEIVLSQLLEKMMRIVIENAGAQHGFLILPQDDQWVIEAEGAIDKVKVTVLHSLPVENHLPEAIISYVAHTQENVVLTDARQEGLYTDNPYIKTHQTQSVLCFPIVYQQQLRAILYFENNLTKGAFTPSRLKMLNLLSSQIAISLENSLRTRKLEQEIILRKKAEKAAEASSQAKTAFLANMTHEVRTPLNGILGYVQILQKNPSLTTEQQHALNVIEQNGHHLLNLMSDVLELTQAGIDKLELYETDFNLRLLLSNVNKIVIIWSQEKGIDFYLDVPNVLPEIVCGDERRLRKVLFNLLNNAVKFTHQGHVTLKVRFNQSKDDKSSQCRGKPVSPNWHQPDSSDLFHFQIEDTGIGISFENLETIFEPFEQVGKEKLETKGTGLGLTISKNLVELMGGQLCVSSQIDVGTQFWFELMLKKPSSNTNLSRISFDQIEKTADTDQNRPLVFPPIADLEKLYELSEMGDMDEIEQQVSRLAESDNSLKPFKIQVQTFLKKYQLDELSQWLKRGMNQS